MNPFTAVTPNYPPDVQRWLSIIAATADEEERTFYQQKYARWYEAEQAAKRKAAETNATKLPSGVTPEQLLSIVNPSGFVDAAAAEKLANYLGGGGNPTSISKTELRPGVPPYYMVTVYLPDGREVPLGAGPAIVVLALANKATADKNLADLFRGGWNPPALTFAQVFFGA